MIYAEILKRYLEYDKDFSKKIIGCRPWGNHSSIVIFTSDNKAYKIKMYNNKFFKQALSKNDINKKFNNKINKSII